MLTQPILEKLYDLRLQGMAEAFQRQLAEPDACRLSFEERFGLIVDHHWNWRESRALERRLKNARLRLDASIEDLDYRTRRGLDRSLIASLAGCQWAARRLNILITGPCGVGKTFLACALAHKAVREGYTACYARTPRLLRELALARADGSLDKLLRKIARIDVLLVDDWAMAPLNDWERRDFLEICEDRYDSRSTILTSQLPLSLWHDQVGDPTMADSILDRLVHNAYRLEMQGASMRKGQAGRALEAAAKEGRP